MYTQKSRPHTDAEKTALLNQYSQFKFKITDVIGVTFLSLVFYGGGGWFLGKGINYGILRVSEQIANIGVFQYVLCGIGSLWAIVSSIRSELIHRSSLQNTKKQIDDSILNGSVQEIYCDASVSVELAEYEDEGPGYFLQIEPEIMLFVQGQYLMDDKYPTTTISIVRDLKTGFVFSTEFSGQYLKPERTIASTQYGGTSWLHDGLFLQGKVKELPDTIDALPEPTCDALSSTK